MDREGELFRWQIQRALTLFIPEFIPVRDFQKEKEVEELLKKLPLALFSKINEDFKALSHFILIRESIQKISHYTGDIAELIIDRTYEAQRS